MRSTWFGLGCAIALIAGCDTDNVGVFIAGNVVPETGEASGGCSLEPGNPTLTPPGRFNIERAPGGYRVFPLYQNQLIARTSPTGADPNGVRIKRAEVEILKRDASGNLSQLALSGVANPFSVETSTFVPSSEGGGASSRAVGGFAALSSSHRDALSVDDSPILLAIRVFGETNGNTGIATEAWHWPVELCGGNCLERCVEGGDAEGPCFPYQDFPVPVDCSGGM